MKAIITGGTKGIGKAIGQLFLEKGVDIAINSRSQVDLEAVQAEFQGSFPEREILIKQTDVSKPEEVKAFGEFVKSQWDKIDILINNAGVYVMGQLLDESEDVMVSQINTNLYSAVHMTRSILPVMLPQNAGTIINMCSIASLMSYPNSGSYTVSKFALHGYTKVLRDELKEKGIRVVAVMPGATWSAAWGDIDLPKERLMAARDIALVCWNAVELSPSAVIEDIVIRPQLGDL
jgi:short-subunit dehydrogenase